MKSNEALIYIGIAAMVGLGVYYLAKKEEPQDEEEFLLEEPVNETPVQPTQPTQPAQPVAPNANLVLKKGSKGVEVKELQKLLGTNADGDFGPITENLLFAKKGVKQISLNQYKSKPDVPKNPLAVGNSVMANKKPSIKVYENKILANGNYRNTGVVFTTFDYGDKVGVIKALTNDKLHYIVEVDRTFVGKYLVWVQAADVVKI